MSESRDFGWIRGSVEDVANALCHYEQELFLCAPSLLSPFSAIDRSRALPPHQWVDHALNKKLTDANDQAKLAKCVDFFNVLRSNIAHDILQNRVRQFLSSGGIDITGAQCASGNDAALHPARE